jgi:hypothetical protein
MGSPFLQEHLTQAIAWIYTRLVLTSFSLIRADLPER